MTLDFYVRLGVAYIPTMAQTDAGFYLLGEPIEVATVSDAGLFADALRKALARGNPVVPAPRRDEYRKPEVLKYAGVKSWAQFERESSYWTLSDDGGVWKFGPCKRRKDRGWEGYPSKVVKLPPGSTIDDATRAVVTAVQAST